MEHCEAAPFAEARSTPQQCLAGRKKDRQPMPRRAVSIQPRRLDDVALRLPESAGLQASRQLAPTESRITLSQRTRLYESSKGSTSHKSPLAMPRKQIRISKRTTSSHSEPAPGAQESAVVGASEQLAPSRSRITLEPKRKALRVIALKLARAVNRQPGFRPEDS